MVFDIIITKTIVELGTLRSISKLHFKTEIQLQIF